MSPTPFELSEATIRQVEPVLTAFAVRAVRHHSLAQDLVQETYLAAIESRASFEGRSTPRTWMVGILLRKIVDHFRRHKREVLVDEVPELEAPTRFATQPYVAPDRHLDDKRAMAVIDRALPELSELERMAVLACDVEQLDREEACNAMGVRPTHLRVLLHRGRHKLRKALEDAALRTG
ncbi:MAG TPA: RNA polymerase sigma factor [Polyangiales bacterium]|jgi:RNA polymerase sigma-70 factor (ECF subfamily)